MKKVETHAMHYEICDQFNTGRDEVIIREQEFRQNGLPYVIRSATEADAKKLSLLRLQIDSETENLDRESGEDFLDVRDFEKIIYDDSKRPTNLFLVAVTDMGVIGFSRCEGTYLKRFSHKVTFGVGVLRGFWGYGIGKNLLQRTIQWADANGIKKINLNVTETNRRAIQLYEQFGFEVEGVLRQDKLLSDGEFYNTMVMGRLSEGV